MKCRLRARTKAIFKYKGYKKSKTTQEILGLNYNNLLLHIESQFEKGMSWENRSEWHIDHIIPLSFAKTEKELIKLCYFTNLQPLWAKDNLSKYNKIL